jgi:hypothetical protein
MKRNKKEPEQPDDGDQVAEQDDVVELDAGWPEDTEFREPPPPQTGS